MACRNFFGMLVLGENVVTVSDAADLISEVTCSGGRVSEL